MLFLPHIMLIWDAPPSRRVLFSYVKLPFDRCVTVMWGNRLFLISLLFFFPFWCRFICVTRRARCLSCEAVWNSSLAATVVRNVLALSFFLTRLREPNTTWVVIKAAACLVFFFSLSQLQRHFHMCSEWQDPVTYTSEITHLFCVVFKDITDD